MNPIKAGLSNILFPYSCSSIAYLMLRQQFRDGTNMSSFSAIHSNPLYLSILQSIRFVTHYTLLYPFFLNDVAHQKNKTKQKQKQKAMVLILMGHNVGAADRADIQHAGCTREDHRADVRAVSCAGAISQQDRCARIVCLWTYVRSLCVMFPLDLCVCVCVCVCA